MVDAVVGLAIMQLYSVEQWIRREILNVVGVEKEVKNLSSKLQSIRNVLDDAENKSVNDKSVESWLQSLEDLSYEMDDVLDEWNTSILRISIQEQEEKGRNNNHSGLNTTVVKKKLSFSSSLNPFRNVLECKRVGVYRFSRDTALKIKRLNKRLESIIKEKQYFNLVPKELFAASYSISSDNSLESKRISTSFVNSSQVYGRMSDKSLVLRKLLGGSTKGANGVQVHSIVGVGGVGKTTLAQLVYNDELVEESFSRRIWICVSNPFDQIKIANEIVESIEGKSPRLSSLELLLQRIKRLISGEKFLLVLDDVWNEDEKQWLPLRNCLEYGANGSRILATTRNERVARLLGTDTVGLHYLGQLPDSDCWLIFRQIAFVGRDEGDYDDKLGEIGRGIIKKCKGLPLAVSSLGGLLRFKRSIGEWQNVLESEMWQLEVENVELFPHMYLSYKDLDPVAKRCFSYCSFFPKGYKVYAAALIRVWMAQGLLTISFPPTNSSSCDHTIELETKGYECLENLVMRSFLQCIELDEDGKVYSCRMHDILHDFARYVSKNEFSIIDNVDSNSKYSLSSGELKTRHLTVKSADPSKDICSRSVCDFSKLRSLMTMSVPIDRLQTADLVSRLKRVRTLIICNSGMEELPKEIGRLIHLRCLCLGFNTFRELPESLGNLINLQVLNIKDCYNLSFLPDSIGKLIMLRQLVLGFSSPKFPQSIQNLTMLRTLKRIVIGREFNNLGCLKNLNQLRDELQVVFEGELNGVNCDDAEDHSVNCAELRNKRYLKTFLLDFNGFKVSENVIEGLTPPPNIQNLEIRYFPGKYFPGWMSNGLNSLKVLEINECEIATCLPPLGELPCLETLYIRRIQSLKKVGRDFLGRETMVCFSKLINLTFSGCEEWEEWEDIGSEAAEELTVTMPRLKNLELIYCPRLRKLPHQLLRNAISLEHVGIYECGLFNCGKADEEEEDSIRVLLTHVKEVEIDYERYMKKHHIKKQFKKGSLFSS